VLEKAARQAAEKDPVSALEYADRYIKEPYAIEIFSKIIQSDPVTWLKEGKNNAIEALSQKGSPLDKQILSIIQRANSEENKEIVFFIDNIVSRGEKYEDIKKELLNPGAFSSKLSAIYYTQTKFGTKSIEIKIKENTLKEVWRINNLHNRPDKERFKSVEKADSKTLYTLITLGEEEVFTSTFNGLFNRLMARLKQENKSAYELIADVDFKNSRTFLKICSRFNRLRDFFKAMSKDQKEELLQRFISNIEKQEDYLSEGVNVADFFGSLKDSELQKYMQGLVKAQYERVKGKSKRGEKIYGLLAGMFADHALMDEKWFEIIAQKYTMENMSSVESKELFNGNINVQAHYFYNDDDGKNSFEHFLNTYSRDASWRIKDKGEYVYIHKEVNGRKMEIYANKPINEDTEEVKKELEKQNIKSIIVVHRGHSYHAQDTINRIPSIAKIVSLGSCGSYSNLNGVLDRAPNAHIISTKGTGTMTVNDDLFKALNEEILSGNNIDWQKFWSKMEQKFGKNDMFKDYIPPNRNLGVMFIKAYRKLEK